MFSVRRRIIINRVVIEDEEEFIVIVILDRKILSLCVRRFIVQRILPSSEYESRLKGRTPNRRKKEK